MYALADAMREEYKAIVDAGFVVQVDDPSLPTTWNRMLMNNASKSDFRKASEMRVEATNYALKGIPEEKVRYHICWASGNTPHTTDVPLREVADIMLKLNAQGFSVEAANPRHEHEWMVWKDIRLQDGKVLIPGVISHQTSVVEHPELVAWRLDNYASAVGRENVIAGTDCGFSQHWDNIRQHPSVQWAKLKAMAEGAAVASKQLWRR